MLRKFSPAIAVLFVSSVAVFAQGGAKPTDPQIAHIAYTAGQLDIDAAQQALKISKNKDVVAFAEGMVKDHTAVNKQALDLCKKLGVTPEDNDTSKSLAKAAADKRTELAKLSGAAFDKAYIANEVEYHKTVNGALEKLLIPSSSNAELKSLLQTGLKLFQGHQKHAESLLKIVQVTIDKMAFGDVKVPIVVGDTIEWVNNDVVDHTATATSKDWDVVIPAGKTARLVMKKAGTEEFYCRFHPNMAGKLTIVAPK